MGAIQGWWRVSGNILVPEGLVIGLQDGFSLPENWNTFSDADGAYLQNGSEALGTTTNATALSQTSSTGGGHVDTNHSGYSVRNRGGYAACAASDWCFNPRRDPTNYGSHSHVVYPTYTPKANDLHLIRCSKKSEVPLGGIMFGDDTITDQTSFDDFNNNTGALLKASTTTGTTAEALAVTSSSTSYYHDHDAAINGDANSYYASGTYYYMPDAGSAHTHVAASSTTTYVPKKILTKAWEIANAGKIKGLIGMWTSEVIPSRWVEVGSLSLLECSQTGDLSIEGTNKLSISGTTNSFGHSHPPTSYSSSENKRGIWYSSSTVSHTHTFNMVNASFQPKRYQIKFIQYVG